MKKIAIVVCSLFLAGLLGGSGNASEYENRERGEYSEHGERYENKFYGTVRQIPENLTGTWIVDGKAVQVTKDTIIEKEYGQPGVGSYVEIEGHYIDKTFTARKIEVKGRNK
ncbi:MAG: DUF5666 domain-containing protein [Pseudomonadota bacterium]